MKNIINFIKNIFKSNIECFNDEEIVNPHINKYLIKLNIIKVYKINTYNQKRILKLYSKSIWKAIDTKYGLIFFNNFHNRLQKEIIIYVKSLDYLLNIISILESKNIFISENKMDVLFLKSELTRIIESGKIRLDDIKKKFNVSICSRGICIYQKVIPERFIVGCPPEYYVVPYREEYIINKIEIFTNMANEICSVKIDAKHPNADINGFYCLGNLKFSQLNIESIENIIKNINVYNLNNCYFVPEYLSKFV